MVKSCFCELGIVLIFVKPQGQFITYVPQFAVAAT